MIDFKLVLERLTGIDKLKEQTQQELKKLQQITEEARIVADAASAAAEDAKRQEQESKLTPKEKASAIGEPYVAVLNTHVNSKDIRHGFFELDWNDEFILQLKQAGYGHDGDPEEEIVDRWFRTLCADVATTADIDMQDRGAGYINVRKLVDNKSEIS